MLYIYAVVHLAYEGGTVCATTLCAYYDKQKAIEVARKLNEQNAKDSLSVSKKYGRNAINHYFVEAISVY